MALEAQNSTLQAPRVLRRAIPLYELMDEEGLVALENQADWILKEIGVEFLNDQESLALLKEAGASVDGTRVRFEPGLAKALCKTAPSSFRMEGRAPKHSVTIGGDSVVFTPAYGPPFVSDLDRGRRYATLEDFQNFVKLAYMTPFLHHSSLFNQAFHGRCYYDPKSSRLNGNGSDCIRCRLLGKSLCYPRQHQRQLSFGF